MAKKRRKRTGLYILIAAITLVVVLFVALTLFINLAGYKPQIEKAASEALGMEVRIKGRLGFGLLPLHVSLNDVVVRNRDSELLAVRQTDIGIEFLPLFRKQVHLRSVQLKRAQILIERGANGAYNVESTDAKPKSGALAAFGLDRLRLSDMTFVYADKKTGAKSQLSDCDLVVDDVKLRAGRSSDLARLLSFDADLTCEQLRSGKLAASNLHLRANAKNGVFDFKPFTLQVFGGKGSGNMHADLSEAARRVEVRYDVENIQTAELMKAIWPGRSGSGNMDFTLRLTLQGAPGTDLKRNMDGDAHLRGKNLVIQGADLDKQIERFEASQSFDLIDAGAFFFMGPIGIVATKGQDYASLFMGSGGTTRVNLLVSDWHIDNGTAYATDVAMATNRNRLAVKGRLNFVADRFDDMTIAVIDARGCAKAQQTVRGPFANPSIDKPGVFKAIAAPVVRLFKGLTNSGNQCKVFYAGSVGAPK